MTTAQDFPLDDDETGEDDAQRNREGYADRKARRDAERKELEDLRAFKEATERERAIDKALGDLNATGPIKTFLGAYKGEPTADAIRKAVESDDDWKTLIVFTPDPRDEAAREQASNAAKMKGGDPVGGVKPNSDVSPGLTRLERAHAERATAKT